jgi:hypothetical protein
LFLNHVIRFFLKALWTKTLTKSKQARLLERCAECQAWIFFSAGHGDGKITEPPL